ncbi:MAG: alpha/beta hydrolase [Acidimicrobiia bacterium]
MRMRTFFWGVFWTLVALALVFHAAGGWYFSDELIEDGFIPDPEPIALTNGDYELEEVTYDSPLGAMDAWQLPADGTTWVIHIHGLGATPAEAEPLFAPLQDAGYQQLSITYRNDEGQPEDPSGYYRYGATEWEDVSAAADYATANGAEAIVLSGFSTGAGLAMSFLSREPREIVTALLMDSPNVNLSQTVDYQASQRELPLIPANVPPTLAATAKFITSLRIGVNWKLIDYIADAERTIRQPVLIHHGTADLSVPLQESVDLAAANPDLIQLIEVPGAGHVESYDVDLQKYVDDVIAFLPGPG